MVAITLVFIFGTADAAPEGTIEVSLFSNPESAFGLETKILLYQGNDKGEFKKKVQEKSGQKISRFYVEPGKKYIIQVIAPEYYIATSDPVAINISRQIEKISIYLENDPSYWEGCEEEEIEYLHPE